MIDVFLFTLPLLCSRKLKIIASAPLRGETVFFPRVKIRVVDPEFAVIMTPDRFLGKSGLEVVSSHDSLPQLLKGAGSDHTMGLKLVPLGNGSFKERFRN